MKKNRLLSMLLVIALLMAMIPAAASASTVKYVKTSNGLSLNVRSAMKTHTDNVIGHLAYGTKVTVLKTYKGGWSYVSWGTKNASKGYVVSSALSSVKPGNVQLETRYIYDDSRAKVNIRSSMTSHKDNIVITLKVGAKVQLVETYANGWSQVRYGNYKGYVQTWHLKTQK